MISFTALSQMIRDTARMSKLMTAEDGDIAAVCSADIDNMIRMQRELKPLLDSLPCYDLQMVVLLRYVKGYTCRQCADAMNISERSAYYFSKAARKRLMEMYPDTVKP